MRDGSGKEFFVVAFGAVHGPTAGKASRIDLEHRPAGESVAIDNTRALTRFPVLVSITGAGLRADATAHERYGPLSSEGSTN